MQISGTMQVATDHILDAKKRLTQNAQAIAQAPSSTKQEDPTYMPKSLEEAIVDNMQIKYEIQASSLVVKTADEVLGTLLDTKA